MEECEHEKVFDSKYLLSNPPQVKWVCKRCKEEGYDIVGVYQDNARDYLMGLFEIWDKDKNEGEY